MSSRSPEPVLPGEHYVTPAFAEGMAAGEGVAMDRVDLWITGRCNQRCVFCYLYADEVWDQGPDDVPEDVEEVLQAGRARGYEELYISGGEPTINKSFPAIVARASELGFTTIKVMSNALRFASEKFTRACAEAGLTNIAISIHGADSDTYAEVHRTPGGFEKLLKAIHNLQTVGASIAIEFNTVVTSLNVAKLPDLVRLADELGIRRIHTQKMVPNSPGLFEFDAGREAVLEAFREAVATAQNVRLELCFMEPCLMRDLRKHMAAFDFTVSFFTPHHDSLLGWQESLMKSKHVAPGCATCADWEVCRGFWSIPGDDAELEWALERSDPLTVTSDDDDAAPKAAAS